jgi:hypothetical protein
VELAGTPGTAQQGRLTVAAISAVFTINHVAALLGEDEDWLHDLSIDMFPEDGCLHVYGVGEDGVTAFTQDGIDNLKQVVEDERKVGRAPPNPGSPR